MRRFNPFPFPLPFPNSDLSGSLHISKNHMNCPVLTSARNCLGIGNGIGIGIGIGWYYRTPRIVARREGFRN